MTGRVRSVALLLLAKTGLLGKEGGGCFSLAFSKLIVGVGPHIILFLSAGLLARNI